MRTLTHGLLLAALALGTACSSDSSPTGPSGAVLTLGTARSVSGATDSEQYFTVVVPAGAPSLRVTLSGGTGDADLIINFGAQPTPAGFECASLGFDNDEECIVLNPAAGTWHILVYGASAYSGAQLLAQVVTAPTATALSSGVGLTNQSGAESSSRYFSIVVPAGASNLTVTTTGGTGDVDLFVRRGSFPSTGVNDCASEDIDNAEICTLSSPAAGTWYVMLYGWEAYTGVTLRATVTVP